MQKVRLNLQEMGQRLPSSANLDKIILKSHLFLDIFLSVKIDDFHLFFTFWFKMNPVKHQLCLGTQLGQGAGEIIQLFPLGVWSASSRKRASENYLFVGFVEVGQDLSCCCSLGFCLCFVVC